VRAAGAQVSRWEPGRGAPASAAPRFAVADLRALVTPDTSLIIVNNIHIIVIAANLEALDAFARRWPRVLEWRPPAAGTVAFPRLNVRLLGAPDVGAACEALAREGGVLLLPATVYDHAPSAAAGRARVSFGRAGLPAALAALEESLRRRGLRPWTAGDPPPEPW
jgi:hypothetical protein